MNVTTHPQPKASDFYSTYTSNFSSLDQYFTYSWDNNDWTKRFEELSYPAERREQMVATIREGMKSVTLSNQQTKNLQLLAEGASVTIAGQQTGLLTGPIYSIHKAVTAIHLAKQMTETSGKPVVPIFWMAGEDHDILEVNHFFIEKNRDVSKLSLSVEQLSTEMVANRQIDQAEMKGLLSQAFHELPETPYTKELWTFLIELLDEHNSYKEYFLHAFQHFFARYGLLFVNSSDHAMRELGKPFTKLLIERNEKVRQAVYHTEQMLAEEGYGFPIQCRLENAHLFYVKDDHRYLLEATETGFANKELNQNWTAQQLLHEVEENPSVISHNVVTRPLMQQFLFPVHSFIGGPGEIAYWALLKDAFAAVDLKMPIVTPRFSITVLPLSIEQKMKDLGVTLEDAWNGSIPTLMHEFIDQQKDKSIVSEIKQMNEWLEHKYQDLTSVLQQEDISLDPLLEKNKALHKRQFTFLEQQIEDVYMRRFDSHVAAYKAVENELVPAGSLQERIYSPLAYLNKYGFEVIDRLVEVPYKLTAEHYVVHMN
ncbi:bacillithiol biosynthesis cysteine-adding enzyme BshC [Chryseomicrobium sp. FSL W7-1435]|uniref:bacillithiol biosynthesis cysteine-adding enzyme BshC n=1 Tax=Chryseomicrobium sp. FSL W7-1435 TaxID=2921704 RepID=UPI00315AAAF0